MNILQRYLFRYSIPNYPDKKLSHALIRIFEKYTRSRIELFCGSVGREEMRTCRQGEGGTGRRGEEANREPASVPPPWNSVKGFFSPRITQRTQIKHRGAITAS
jgi:hypothetical protein